MTLPGLVAAKNLLDVENKERAWDNLGSNISVEIPIPAPSLDLNFAKNKTLIDDISGNNLITFSRASSGTFVGSNGLVQTAASGVPRFDHNPVTGESLGLLIEEARTNFVSYSTDITSLTGWSNISTGVMTSSNTSAAAPDGTTAVSELTLGAVNSFWGKQVSYPASTACAMSFWARVSDGGGNFSIGISWTNDSGAFVNFFNIALTSSWTRYTITATTPASTSGRRIVFRDNQTGATNGRRFLAWGVQMESGAFSTSYIPTDASTVTRAADLASISGANFESWFRQDEGTTLCDFLATGNQQFANPFSYGVGTASGQQAVYRNNSNTSIGYGAWGTGLIATIPGWLGLRNRAAGAYRLNDLGFGINGSVLTASTTPAVATSNTLRIGDAYNLLSTPNKSTGTIARLVYWPLRLGNTALQFITSASNFTLPTVYSYTFTVKGKDIFALNGVSRASTRDFVFIKGLSSPAQPRLTTAAQQTASGTVFQGAAMLKASPTTSGNYLFSSGLTLSGVSTRINSTPALSIATSPFSGSTATVSILLRELQPQANWRITEPMPSGTLASPEFAIPFETSDFVLFMKAGQN